MTVQVSEYGSQDVSIHTPRWKPILRAWGRLMDQYYVGTDGDLAYAYNERASVGMLALAIREANTNNLALEEYSCGRRNPDRDQDAPLRGRADLWTRISSDTYSMEAKFLWVSCQVETPWLGKVRPTLAAAMRQVQQYEELSTWLVGGVFAVPYLAKNVEITDSRLSEVRRVIKGEEPRLGAHSGIRADYYPPLTGEKRFPGVSLFLAFRKR